MKDLHTKQIGNVGEASVAADLMRRDYRVFTEMGDSCCVDLIALKGDELLRIQVKAMASRYGEYVDVRLKSSGPSYSYVYTSEDIDVFAVYIYDLEKIAYFRMSELGGVKCITLRFTPTKNGQSKGTHMHSDYEGL